MVVEDFFFTEFVFFLLVDEVLERVDFYLDELLAEGVELELEVGNYFFLLGRVFEQEDGAVDDLVFDDYGLVAGSYVVVEERDEDEEYQN